MSRDVDVVLRLPDDLRAALKDPLGPVTPDPGAVIDAAGTPLIAVGDIVTDHLTRAGRTPDVALVDGRTKRESVDPEIRQAVEAFDERMEVANPPATVTAPLLASLRDALDREGSTVIVVDGEEDLAALPAVAAAPAGASVVYGQPGEGMVHVRVGGEIRERVRSLLSAMDGDHDRFGALIGVESG